MSPSPRSPAPTAPTPSAASTPAPAMARSARTAGFCVSAPRRRCRGRGHPGRAVLPRGDLRSSGVLTGNDFGSLGEQYEVRIDATIYATATGISRGDQRRQSRAYADNGAGEGIVLRRHHPSGWSSTPGPSTAHITEDDTGDLEEGGYERWCLTRASMLVCEVLSESWTQSEPSSTLPEEGTCYTAE